MICGENGLPLNTKRLAQDPADAPDLNGVGPALQIVFEGAEPADSVFAHLDLRNTSDLNANGIHYGVSGPDENEGNPIDNPDLLKNSIESFVHDESGAISEAQVGCEVGQTCPKRKFAYFNGGLNVEIEGYLSPSEAMDRVNSGELRQPLPTEVVNHGGVLFYAYPTVVQASNLVAYAETSYPLITADPADTRPMIMRVRHQCDARDSGSPNPPNAQPLPKCDPDESGLIEAWIVNADGGSPEVIANLDSYLDAPALEPTLSVGTADHNVYSLGLDAGLMGPVEFLDDGRMQIAGINQSKIDATMELDAVGGFAGGSVTLRIPAEGIRLSFLSQAPLR